MKLGSAVVVVVGFFVCAAFWPAPRLDTAPERFTATSLNANHERTGRVEIVIERRSTEGERQRLIDSLKDDEHSQHLLETIQTLPRVGYLQGETGRACELHYAYGVKGEDGSERVILATDRPVPFDEAGSPADRTGGPFTLIELRVMNNGLGQGKLSLVTATMADASQRPTTLEDYDIEPLLLLSVRRGLTTR
jgi:hypothetical protein